MITDIHCCYDKTKLPFSCGVDYNSTFSIDPFCDFVLSHPNNKDLNSIPTYTDHSQLRLVSVVRLTWRHYPFRF